MNQQHQACIKKYMCGLGMYEAWIEAAVQDPEGRCKQESKRLARAFPELTMVRGTVQILGKYGTQHTQTHWWCKTADGEIVDPTKHQFAKVWGYDEVANATEPVARCPNCGDYFQDSGGVCSDVCHKQYMEYLNADH